MVLEQVVMVVMASIHIRHGQLQLLLETVATMVVVELDQNILEVELYLVVLEVEVMVLSSQVQIGKVLLVLVALGLLLFDTLVQLEIVKEIA